MDMWGAGCEMFEVAALFPLFPGANEVDQIQKMHKIMGTPSKELLGVFKLSSSHSSLQFTEYRGTGIAKMLPHMSSACVDLILKLLIYDPNERISARHALRHRW